MAPMMARAEDGSRFWMSRHPVVAMSSNWPLEAGAVKFDGEGAVMVRAASIVGVVRSVNGSKSISVQAR